MRASTVYTSSLPFGTSMAAAPAHGSMVNRTLRRSGHHHASDEELDAMGLE